MDVSTGRRGVGFRIPERAFAVPEEFTNDGRVVVRLTVDISGGRDVEAEGPRGRIPLDDPVRAGSSWSVIPMSDDDRDGPRSDLPTTRDLCPPPAGERRQVGPYVLLQKIGEGGIGEVWLAEQTAPVRRKVALKVIKQSMDTEHVVARFEAEKQALAMMDHPCVAKVFDAGSTPQGRTYFVMEYVLVVERVVTGEGVEPSCPVRDGGF